MDAFDKYKFWLDSEYFDEDTKKELLSIKDNKEIEDRFYTDLDFGTGGLRGKIGAGTNRMNIYTVSKATQGIANYIIKNNYNNPSVVIAYDSRNKSLEFAQSAALCFAANGIKAYIFPNLHPTPTLSFAIKYLGCTAGVVITASHNPKEYNGYKLYWSDACQITPPLDKEIINEISNINDFANIKKISKEQAIRKSKYIVLDSSIDKEYMAAISKKLINRDFLAHYAKNLKIVYTPLHGTGTYFVKSMLEKYNFDLHLVNEQLIPDGNFPTVEYPNPEDENAFDLAIEYAKKIDADIVLATDPDADRIGMYAKKDKSSYVRFSGNMTSTLLLNYIINQKLKTGFDLSKEAIISTIVSGKMPKKIAKFYNIPFFETLTGFKYIGEMINNFEYNNSYRFMFGYEESYGTLIGNHARDKDAVITAVIICEMAAYYKKLGITLYEKMIDLYEKYGYYKEDTISRKYEGKDGLETIKRIMDSLRQSKLCNINYSNIVEFRDYLSSKIYIDNNVYDTQLPKSNVLYVTFSDESWCCFRPSGTEPKLKVYIGTSGKTDGESNDKIKLLKSNIINVLEIISKR